MAAAVNAQGATTAIRRTAQVLTACGRGRRQRGHGGEETAPVSMSGQPVDDHVRVSFRVLNAHWRVRSGRRPRRLPGTGVTLGPGSQSGDAVHTAWLVIPPTPGHV